MCVLGTHTVQQAGKHKGNGQAEGFGGDMRWAEGSEQHYAMAELLRATVSSVSRPGKPYLICHMQADDLQVAGQLQGSSCIA